MKRLRLVARRMKRSRAEWRGVAADLAVPGIVAVVVVSADAGPARDRLVAALRAATQPRMVAGGVAVLEADPDGADAEGAVLVLQFERPSMRRHQSAALWRWTLATALPEAARAAGGVPRLSVDVAGGDRAGNEAVARWMGAARLAVARGASVAARRATGRATADR